MATPAGGEDSTLPTLALLLAMFLWASSFIALKLAFRAYDPMAVIFGRMLVASLCFLFVARRITRSLDYQRGDYKLILLMAFCEPCLYFLFEAQAVANTTASQAGMITAILPILVMVAAAFLLKERSGPRAWFGALVALSGVIWLSLASSPSEEAPNPMLGNFLEFLAMICATGYTITMKALTRRYAPFFLTAVQAVVGCLFYLPILFLPGTELPTSFQPVPAFAVLYLGAVITLGAYGLYNYALKYVDASRAAAFVNLIPLFAVLLGWLILDESFNRAQFFAAGVIMFGVFLSRR